MFFFFFKDELGMKLKSFKIENFKSIQNMEIFFNENLSVLTGTNNCGKTTIIEAVALWVECFEKLISQAKKTVKGRYSTGDYILGPSTNRYFEFGEINSVRAPHFEDIFINRDIKKVIKLTATISNDDGKNEIKIPVSIRSSTKSRYAIKLENESTFKYKAFNTLFSCWPRPIADVYATPVATIDLNEEFKTVPQLQELVKKRESYKILRNRLYRLYHSSNAELFKKFENDVSYILYNTSTVSKIQFFCNSDINRDKEVLFTFKFEEDPVEKDISLLGSGSLQIIEILLNVYNYADDKKDFVLILLDEPDSHIHRDMQQRLLNVLKRISSTNQIIVTTHNESMIRSTPLKNLYHVDSKMKIIKAVESGELADLNNPHFSGLYPSALTDVVKCISGQATGLDFVSALEADRIVFVEGEDDARLLYCLFRKRLENARKKIVFWVLGGVSKVIDQLGSFHMVFSGIHNGSSLWEKSMLVFDQDRMIDEHSNTLIAKLMDKYSIPSLVLNVYTQESVLLTDAEKTFYLLMKLFQFDYAEKHEFIKLFNKKCADEEQRVKKTLDLQSICDGNKVAGYWGEYLEKMNVSFGCNYKKNEQIASKMAAYYQTQPLYKIAGKSSVSAVINSVFNELGLDYVYDDSTFYKLAHEATEDLFFPEWNKLVDFIGR